MNKRKTKFIHHQKGSVQAYIREVVFGAQDGMVSTLGAITGVAVGSQNHFVVVLAGLVVIAVESISMAMGSYTSSLSEKNIRRRMVREAEQESERESKADERKQLEEMFARDGWPEELRTKMAETAATDQKLWLREMTYRHLGLSPESSSRPVINGVFMFFAYIVGGLIPLFPYFFASISVSIPVSIGVTLAGLFILGALIGRYSRSGWVRGGTRIFLLGGTALLAGYAMGELTPLLLG